tara:strand:- start:331 stop:525 length:195 start_codon:yes stop_codon:yes gene_type:complete
MLYYVFDINLEHIYYIKLEYVFPKQILGKLIYIIRMDQKLMLKMAHAIIYPNGYEKRGNVMFPK